MIVPGSIDSSECQSSAALAPVALSTLPSDAFSRGLIKGRDGGDSPGRSPIVSRSVPD